MLYYTRMQCSYFWSIMLTRKLRCVSSCTKLQLEYYITKVFIKTVLKPSYDASIMHNAFRDQLCSELCWHNNRPDLVTYMDTHAHTHIYVHAYSMYVYIHVNTQLYKCTHTSAYTNPHTCSHTEKHMRAHVRTHTHTHNHTYASIHM